MSNSPVSKPIRNLDDMAALAETIATDLGPGDCILLDGIIGAGKSFFARHLIQSRLSQPEDVPSPTFTLVQVYDTSECEIWHSDLYRLSSLDEIYELGLIEAFDNQITLVEWPQKLQDEAPNHALWMTISLVPEHEDARTVQFQWTDPKWASLIEKISNDHTR